MTVRIGQSLRGGSVSRSHCGRGAALLRVGSILLVTFADKRKCLGGMGEAPGKRANRRSEVLVRHMSGKPTNQELTANTVANSIGCPTSK